jgi:hypothetical protein
MSRLVFALLFALTGASSLRAVETPDQSNVVTVEHGNPLTGLLANARYTPAQVVTTGMSGQLSRVELSVFRFWQPPVTAPLFVDIVRADGGVPVFTDAGRLATREIAAASVPIWQGISPVAPSFNLSVDFSADHLALGAQDQFAILLRSPVGDVNNAGPPYYIWRGDFFTASSTYAGGSSFTRIAAGGQVVDHAADTQFRTFMTVPEPSAVVLIACSLFGLLLIRRRGAA